MLQATRRTTCRCATLRPARARRSQDPARAPAYRFAVRPQQHAGPWPRLREGHLPRRQLARRRQRAALARRHLNAHAGRQRGPARPRPPDGGLPALVPRPCGLQGPGRATGACHGRQRGARHGRGRQAVQRLGARAGAGAGRRVAERQREAGVCGRGLRRADRPQPQPAQRAVVVQLGRVRRMPRLVDLRQRVRVQVGRAPDVPRRERGVAGVLEPQRRREVGAAARHGRIEQHAQRVGPRSAPADRAQHQRAQLVRQVAAVRSASYDALCVARVGRGRCCYAVQQAPGHLLCACLGERGLAHRPEPGICVGPSEGGAAQRPMVGQAASLFDCRPVHSRSVACLPTKLASDFTVLACACPLGTA